MRSLFRISFALLLGATFITGCKSNSTDPGSGGGLSSPGMTATINGTAWTGQVAGFRHAGPLNNLQFEGWVNTPFQQIPIGVSPDVTGPGTYPFVRDQQSGQIASTSYNTMSASYSDNVQGSLTITSLTNTNVQGTFFFTAKDGMGESITVANGKFNVPLH